MNAEPTGQDMLAVDIHAIKDEWMRLWKESSATQANDGHPATRNSVLNLVVFTQRAATASAVDSALDSLCRQHPARMIVLVANAQGGPSSMSAKINLSTYQDRERWGTNTNELVTIEAQGGAVDYLPSVVLSLLAANLPVFTWWADAPSVDMALFDNLAGVSDRLIVDSAEFEEVGPRFQMLARISRSREYRCAVSDLNWQRSAPWRELAAQFFDPVPLQPYLQGVAHILIEYAGTEANGRTVGVSNPAQALLLVGWAASKLGWRVVPGEQKHTGGTYNLALRSQDGAPISIEIRPRTVEAKKRRKPTLITGPEQLEESAPAASPAWAVSQTVAGALSTVTITSVHAGHTGVFSIRRSVDHEHATTSVTIDGVAQGPERTVHLDSIGRAELMSAELETFDHDGDFEDALSVSGALAL
jgi:glucose-6-phosphate dehydrogenase assembly protein OpcA